MKTGQNTTQRTSTAQRKKSGRNTTPTTTPHCKGTTTQGTTTPEPTPQSQQTRRTGRTPGNGRPAGATANDGGRTATAKQGITVMRKARQLPNRRKEQKRSQPAKGAKEKQHRAETTSQQSHNQEKRAENKDPNKERRTRWERRTSPRWELRKRQRSAPPKLQCTQPGITQRRQLRQRLTKQNKDSSANQSHCQQ